MAFLSKQNSNPAPGHVLITGSKGFTAAYVNAALLEAGYQITGCSEDAGAEGEQLPLDIRSPEACRAVIDQTRPDYIVHLAAISFVGHSEATAFYDVNVIGTLNLLQACADIGHTPRKLLIASSANIYGNASGTIDEATLPAPTNHYAASKLVMEHLVHTWSDRLPIVMTRPFNYTGRGQSPRFLVAKIVAHFAERRKHIELGNLDVARDFSDVRYVAAIYRALLEADIVGETVNICSGEAHSLADIISLARDLTGHNIEVTVNPAFVRTNEVKMLKGTPIRLRELTPHITPIDLKTTLSWMLEK